MARICDQNANRDATPRAQIPAPHDDALASPENSPERELKVVESTVNDQDGEDEWRTVLSACVRCGCTKVYALARVTLSHLPGWADCELEESDACPHCGLLPDADELVTAILEQVEAEYSDDF